MYFKSSLRNNPAKNTLRAYYRLVESYRNGDDRICNKTMLNIGFLPGGIKNYDKVQQRIGRCIEKYPSAAKNYTISVARLKKFATEISWTKMLKNETKVIDNLCGYFI